MIERQLKTGARIALDHEVLIAIGSHVLARFGGGEFGRRAVLVSGANIEHFVALKAPKPRVHVRRQHRACQIAEMLDAVNVRQC